MEEYGGMMSLSTALRQENKDLRAELVLLRVEHEKLRMEEGFLRDDMCRAGMEAQCPPKIIEIDQTEALLRPPTAERRRQE